MTAPMLKTERDELAKVVRLRARVAKADVDQRQAQLLADVEGRLAASFDAHDEVWADLTMLADEGIRKLDDELARRCDELGVSLEFRPFLRVQWYGRGANAEQARRAELRKVAERQLEASGRKAKLEVDKRTAELLTALHTDGIDSEKARNFLAAMPSIEQLMPKIQIPELERGNPIGELGRIGRGVAGFTPDRPTLGEIGAEMLGDGEDDG